MAILDNIFVRVQPVAGESAVSNIVTSSAFTGTGTPTLLDETGLYFWRVAAGTLLKSAASYTMDASTGGITICMRFRRRVNGTDEFMPLVGWLPSGGAVTNCPAITSQGASVYRGRLNNASQGVTSTSGKALNVIHTLVWRFETSAAANQDFGKLWYNRSDRVGTAPDVTSPAANSTTTSFIEAFINCQTGAEFDLFDFMVWGVAKTEAECAGLADDVRSLIPAPSSATHPSGTVTLGTIVPNPTGATVHFTYSASDQTGFEYQLNDGGTIYPISASPATPTGLTPSTGYTIRVRAVNASVDGTWSTSEPFTTSDAAVSFVGGPVPDQVATVGTPYSLLLAPYFTGTLTPFTYSFTAGVLTGTGLSLNTSTGVISGTPTVTANLDLQVSATDTGTNTGVTNLFALDIAAAGSPPAGTFTVGTITTTQATASVPYTYSAVDADSIQYRIDGGAAVTATASPQSITGLTASTTYGIEFRAVNAFGNGAWSTSAPFTTAAAAVPSFTLTDLVNNAGAPIASTGSITVDVYNQSTGALVVRKTGLISTAGADVVVSDAALTIGNTYNVFITIGTAIGSVKATAS